MATNINVELFKRYAPKKKLEIIEKLNPNELMNVTTATITRIVKEAGKSMYKSRNKRLYISRDRQRGIRTGERLHQRWRFYWQCGKG